VKTILFFEKPGCAESLRQKSRLAAAGYKVDARDLTSESWTPGGLRGFFADKPVAEWFDPRAPKILSGEIDPAKITPQAALVMMAVDPSLIRSPLLKYDGRCGAGGLAEAEMDVLLGLKRPCGVLDPRSNAPRAWGGGE
jgi:nitrogenase-associated protein